MFSIVIALAAAASQPAPSASQPADLQAWVQEVNRRIDSHLARPDNGDAGMATVSFRRGEDGRPVEMSVKSSSPSLSRAAIRTIRATGALPPMPSVMASNQRITFKFLVGVPGHDDDYLLARARMLAAADHANTVLAARLSSQTQVAALDPR